MNCIVLKTENGEYHPGDVVVGSVYLNIVRPTAGRGVKLDIYISEEFKYNSVDEEGYLKSNAKKINHLKQENVILYEADSPFSLGSYIFPFTFTIPENAAGSFCCISTETPAWKGVSQCVVIATVLESDSLTDSQPIIVLNCSKTELDNRLVVSPESVVHHVRSVLNWKRNKGVSVTYKLLKNIYRTGDSLQLRLIVANNTKLNITAFKIKFLRYIVFKDERDEKVKNEIGVHSPAFTLVRYPVTIQPEGGPCVIWENFGLLDRNISLMNNVLDNILIPLRNKDGVPILPSICGQCIECKYGLEIAFTLNNGSSITINHSVPCILPQFNKCWESVILPEWAKTASVLPS